MTSDADKLTSSADCIRVRGARVHNLRGVDVDIPRQRLTVITGVSGSGKSSLAFDAIHAESQRRYLASLATETRSRVAAGWQRPDVDVIDGLPPTISVGQAATAGSLRSTLATTTEVLDYLRLLFARCGQAHCPQCDRPLSARSAADIVQQIMRLEAGRKVMILAPLVRGKKGAHREVYESIAKLGFVRIRVDGQIVEASQPPTLAKTKAHSIEAIVDRIVVKEGLQTRLRESVELALKHGSGTCVLSLQAGDSWEDHAYSSRFACAECGVSFAELEPRTFSFNSPFGACLSCRGLGVVAGPDDTDQETIAVRQSERIRICPGCDGSRLSPFARRVTFGGMTLPVFLRLTVSEAIAVVTAWGELAQRRHHALRDEPNALSTCHVDRQPNVQTMSNGDSARHAERDGYVAESSNVTARILDRTLPAIRSRLEFLRKVGADYLSLDRPTRSLSGGEFQRARLAACLGSGLTGAGYVLDEPTVGLHPKDTAAMIATLHELRDQGNTVIVVEHDPDVMRHADYLIDLGPGAGADGGRVVACGSPADVAQNERSMTGRYLRTGSVNEKIGERGGVSPPAAAGPCENRGADATPLANKSNDWLTLRDVSVHNLRNISARIPLRRLTAITGVSGSGKTSLVHHALVPAVVDTLAKSVGETRPQSGDRGYELTGVEHIARLIEVTQAPIGRSPVSNPATYSGVWDELCRLFAATREAKLRGFRASRFKFNSPSGRCDACRGRGIQRVRLQLLPDAFVTCSACRGDRFNAATLQVRYRGHSAADVLRMRIEVAYELFANVPKVARVLKTFVEVGLGYLQLGQAATTLSGGEAQRVKLATELSRERPESTLFVLDEPTTGLHPADVERLLNLLRRVVDAGHTVVVIEHHLDIIAAADWLIDLGPDGGSHGGQIIAEGTPTEIATRGEGHTAKALAHRE